MRQGAIAHAGMGLSSIGNRGMGWNFLPTTNHSNSTTMDFITIIAQAAPPASGGGGAMGILGNPLVLFAVIIGIFFFMIIRPQQKKLKEHQNLISSVKRGDKVVMGGGIHGTVHEVEDKTILVEVSKNNVMKFEKAAVQTVVREG